MSLVTRPWFALLAFSLYLTPVNADIRVELRSLAELQTQRNIALNAQVVSHQTPVISAQVSGEVLQVKVLPGQKVQPEQLLVRLDDADLQDQWALIQNRQSQTQLSLDLARSQLKRAQGLEKAEFVTDAALEELQTQVKILEANLAALKIEAQLTQRQLQRTRIVAPIRGVVTQVMVSQGQVVSPGTPLLQLVHTTKPEIMVQVPLHLVEELKDGQWQQPVFEDFHQVRTPLTLARIQGVINANDRTRTLYLQGGDLVVGQPGLVIFQDQSAVIPAEVLVLRNGSVGVFVAEGKQAKFMPLDNAQEGRPYRLSNQLQPEVQIVVQGQKLLQDGDAIEVVTP